jgi:hypothetical protein
MHDNKLNQLIWITISTQAFVISWEKNDDEQS